MTARTRLIAVAGLALAAGTLAGCDRHEQWTNELVSVNGAGTAGGDRNSGAPVFSPDGTKVAFDSYATDLGPPDTNNQYDVYLRDLTTGVTTMVSVNAAGTDGGDGGSQGPVFSPDGTKIAFSSMASNLGPHDTNRFFGTPDVYVRDLVAGTTTLVSVNAAGTDSAEFGGQLPVFSPDGTKVAFLSRSTDLGPADVDGSPDVYLRDLATATTTLVSTGQQSYAGASWPVFSPDGTKIAFETTAEAPLPDHALTDVLLRDLTTGELTLISVNAAGTGTGNSGSFQPTFSPDGTKIAFESLANDLGPTDSTTCPEPMNEPPITPCRDIYLRDLSTGAVTLVSADAAGTGGGNDASEHPVFSPDGHGIAFQSGASNLGPHDTEGSLDVYLRDLGTGTTRLVSVNAAGTDSQNFSAQRPTFSPDGTRIAFESGATDLVSPPVPPVGRRVYVRNLAAASTSLVATAPDGAPSDRESFAPAWSPTGTRLAFTTAATNLGGPDTNFSEDVYVATLPAADVSVAVNADPDPVAGGAEITYTLDVDNAGPDAAADTAVGLLLPSGTTFVDAASTTGTCAAPPPTQPRSVVCQLGSVDDGESAQVTVTATVTAPSGTTLDALAVVTSSTADPDGPDNSGTRATAVGP
jgi:uncharacterized repeat protein (TIGR01451 family)